MDEKDGCCCCQVNTVQLQGHRNKVLVSTRGHIERFLYRIVSTYELSLQGGIL